MEDMTIGQRIAAMRRRMNLSQIALGELMGVTRQSISKWEADAAIPEIDKLIALSRLFHVSVGWLLGVEENPEPAVEPEREFTDRERELIDILSRSRPAPVWQKYVTIATAVCTAAALAMSGFALHRTTRFQENLKTELQVTADLMTQLFTSGSEGIPDVVSYSQLEDYRFVLDPWEDLTGVDAKFSARPMYYEEGMEAELVILLGTEEVLRQECQWDGYYFTTEFKLNVADGYVPRLLLTSAKGVTITNAVPDTVLAHLGSSMDFGAVSVTFADHDMANTEGRGMHLYDVHIQIEQPDVFRDRPDRWEQCDLVMYRNGQETDRVDLLNRSQYSRQINFSQVDVDFTTGVALFDLGDPQDGDEIRLALECKFTDGLILQYTAGVWTLREGRLVING